MLKATTEIWKKYPERGFTEPVGCLPHLRNTLSFQISCLTASENAMGFLSFMLFTLPLTWLLLPHLPFQIQPSLKTRFKSDLLQTMVLSALSELL